jgi:hypothetical protein
MSQARYSAALYLVSGRYSFPKTRIDYSNFLEKNESPHKINDKRDVRNVCGARLPARPASEKPIVLLIQNHER